MSSVRLTTQVPVTKGVRVLVDHEVDEWRAQLGKWDITLTPDGDLVVRDVAAGYDHAPLIKVPAT